MKRIRILAACAALLATTVAAAPAGRATVYNGSLYDRETGELRLNLSGGYRYVYQGSCDLDCTDLDFALYRWVPAWGNRRGYWMFIASDRAADDTPGLTVTPPFNALYRMDIIMARCSSEPCRYEVEVY